MGLGKSRFCKFGRSSHKPRASSSAESVVPGVITAIPVVPTRVACKYGSSCYQGDKDHCLRFAHPGDKDYRVGSVEFEAGVLPDLQTLWDVFTFFDKRGFGNLGAQEFRLAANAIVAQSSASSSTGRPASFEVEDAWAEVGGQAEGHVGFVRFASWAARFCPHLPVGLDPLGQGAPRRCLSPESIMMLSSTQATGRSCTCQHFQAAMSGSPICKCGHRHSRHRSEAANLPFGKLILCRDLIPAGGSGLMEVRDQELLSQLQLLLDATHKESDNWTRDRGCRLHGVNACKPDCIYNNRAPVPTGYRLRHVLRNKNGYLWVRYSLTRAAVMRQCTVHPNGRPEAAHTESSKPPFDSLGSDGGSSCSSAPLLKNVNEWRLFHGTAEAACREICEKNFALNLAGTGATWRDAKAASGQPLYGPGVYLAESITKADEYAKPITTAAIAGKAAAGRSGPGTALCCVLLCRAVGGCCNVCTRNEIDPQRLREQIFHGSHHSVIGDRVRDLGKPYREIVIYDKDQLYPEYLLFYERIY